MSDASLQTRSPADVGYLAWVLQRASALLLVVLLAVHVAVQVYGFAAPYRWGVYGGLLDITLALVLLHGLLGARATILETNLSSRVRTGLVWVLGLSGLALLVVRILVVG